MSRRHKVVDGGVGIIVIVAVVVIRVAVAVSAASSRLVVGTVIVRVTWVRSMIAFTSPSWTYTATVDLPVPVVIIARVAWSIETTREIGFVIFTGFINFTRLA
jgi:hypothetical protein